MRRNRPVPDDDRTSAASALLSCREEPGHGQVRSDSTTAAGHRPAAVRRLRGRRAASIGPWRDPVRLHHRRRWLGRLRARQPAVGRSRRRASSSSKPAGPDYRFDVFVHMPAALTFPIGSRYYDWGYESEPEPFMDGRRIYHARGKVLGGSSSINGQIFQRGNPLDYERWAADPGHGDVGLRPLPAVLQEDGDLPRGRARRSVARPRRAARPRARTGDQPAVQRRSSRPCQEAGYELTEDVNGYRQEGFAPFDRNIHDGRRLSAAQAYLQAGPRPEEPDRPDADVRDAASCSTAGGRSPSTSSGAAAAPSGSRAARSSSPAARSTRRSSSSCRASGAAEDLAALGIPVVADLPGVGAHLQDHLEVYIQYKSLQPVSMQPTATADVAPAVHRRRVAVPAERAGRDEPLRGRRVRPPQRRRRLPEPDVPLPAAGDPLRRRAPARPATATRSTSGRCTPMPADPSRSRRPIRTTIRRCASTTSRPTRTGASGSRPIRVARHILNQPAMDPFNGGETSPGPVGHDRRRDPRLGRARRRDRAPPVVHGADGDRRRSPCSIR